MKEKRQLVNEEIFSKDYDNSQVDIRFSELPANILPTDIIEIQRDHEGFYSEDNSYPPSCRLIVIREREENDEEFNKRMKKAARLSDDLKIRRFEHYLKLKKEFENGEVYDNSNDGKQIEWSRYCRFCGKPVDDCNCNNYTKEM